MFNKLSDSSLSKAQLNWDAWGKQMPFLANERNYVKQRFKVELTNGGELAGVLGKTTADIAQSVNSLVESKFDPKNRLDADGRQALHNAVIQIANYVRLANAGAVAFSLPPK